MTPTHVWAQKLPRGLIVNIIKATPVFVQPSGKSKVLADVDEGTSLLFKSSSPKKTWIRVEDDEGHRGWVPSARTNYLEIIKAQQLEAKLAREEKQEIEAQQKEKEANKILNQSTHHLALAGRRAYSEPMDRWSFGVYYRFMTSPVNIGNQRLARLGIETAYLHYENAFAVPLRMKWLAQESNSLWASGPDLGIFFIHEKADLTQNHWSGSLGYSFGLHPLQSGLSILLRGAFEFFYKNRLSTELSVGWVF